MNVPSPIYLTPDRILSLSFFESHFEHHKFVFGPLKVDSLDTLKYFATSLLLPLATKVDLILFLTSASDQQIASMNLPGLRNECLLMYEFVVSKLTFLRDKERAAIIRHWFLSLNLETFVLLSDPRKANWLQALHWADFKGLQAHLNSFLAAQQRTIKSSDDDALRQAVALAMTHSGTRITESLLKVTDYLQRLEHDFASKPSLSVENAIALLRRSPSDVDSTRSSLGSDRWSSVSGPLIVDARTPEPIGAGTGMARRALTALVDSLAPEDVFIDSQSDTPAIDSPDTGPPPPEPGRPFDRGAFDDHDLRCLDAVGDYRFGTIVSTLTTDDLFILPHDTQLDEEDFLSLLRASISISRAEKVRIIRSIPKLAQNQCDALVDILSNELSGFRALSPKHLLELRTLEQQAADDWKQIQEEFRTARLQLLWSGQAVPCESAPSDGAPNANTTSLKPETPSPSTHEVTSPAVTQPGPSHRSGRTHGKRGSKAAPRAKQPSSEKRSSKMPRRKDGDHQ